jgi:hypothetical protein
MDQERQDYEDRDLPPLRRIDLKRLGKVLLLLAVLLIIVALLAVLCRAFVADPPHSL